MQILSAAAPAAAGAAAATRGQGRLEVLCGPMFSGKTSELLRRVSAARDAGVKVALVGALPRPHPAPRPPLSPPPRRPSQGVALGSPVESGPGG